MGFAPPATRGFRKGSASSMLDAMTPNQAHPDVNNLGVKLALSAVVVSTLEWCTEVATNSQLLGTQSTAIQLRETARTASELPRLFFLIMWQVIHLASESDLQRHFIRMLLTSR